MMVYKPETIWQPVKPYFEMRKGYLPIQFVKDFGPCSVRHVASRLNEDQGSTARVFRRALADGLLSKVVRLTNINGQQRRVAFYSAVK